MQRRLSVAVLLCLLCASMVYAGRSRDCRLSCASTVDRCAIAGTKRRACKKRTLRDCKRRGLGVCVPQCGDGLVAGDEQCDDGNAVDSDSCKSDCTTNVCGDGVVLNGVEQCDDGNNVTTDSCKSDCRFNVCGDGVVNAGVEQCDDGNSSDSDACRVGCILNVCGDGALNPASEQCDDGNKANGDGCEANCTKTTTGLYGLLGTWDFSYTIISTFTDRFVFQSVIVGNQGYRIIDGEDEFGGQIVAARTADLAPGQPSSYEFAMLDPGFIICQFFVFNRTAAGAVSGLYFQTDVLFDGSCGDISSNGYVMHGTRVSTSTGVVATAAVTLDAAGLKSAEAAFSQSVDGDEPNALLNVLRESLR